MVTGGFRSRAGMDAALQANACDIVGVGRLALRGFNVVNKLLSGAEETTTNFEKHLTIGPKILSPILGLNSPFPFFATINGWGSKGGGVCRSSIWVKGATQISIWAFSRH